MNRSIGRIWAIALTSATSLILVIASGSFLVACGSSGPTTPQSSTIIPSAPPPAPTPIFTPTPNPQTGYTPSQPQMNNVFDGVSNQSQGCSPNFLYYPQMQNFNQYPGGMGNSWNDPNNWQNGSYGAFGGSLNNPTPALNFFNKNINNGYYQPQQPQYSYTPATNNGFYPSQGGYNCMNGIGYGTATIGQIAPYYDQRDLQNWTVQLLVFLYFSSTMQGPPQIINVNGTAAGHGNTTFIYFPN